MSLLDPPSYAKIAATTAAAAAVTTFATDDFVPSSQAAGHGKSAQAGITSAEAGLASIASKVGLDIYNTWMGQTETVTKYEHVVMTGMAFAALDVLKERYIYKRALKNSLNMSSIMRTMLFGTGVAFIGDTLAEDWFDARIGLA